MDIKMIASDLDGTLLKTDGTLSEYTVNILKRACKKGIKIVIASGRAFDTLPDSVKELEYAHYAITSNGAQIYDLKSGSLLKNYLLKKESALKVLDYATGKGFGIELFTDGKAYAERYYFEHPKEFGFGEKSRNYLFTTRTKIENFEEFVAQNINRLESIDYVLKNRSDKNRIFAHFKADEDIYITSSHAKIIEFSHSSCGKGNALSYLLSKEKLSNENLACFGNAQNDLEMIYLAKMGVATENSPKRIKEKSDYICPHCDDDGVAKFIEENIL